MILAAAIVLLVLGSVIFHFASPWYLTPLASNWGAIDSTIEITFWVTGFVFVTVNLFMAYAIVRYRHKRNRRADYEPENKQLEGWLTGITTVGIAALLAPGLFVWADFVRVPEDAHEVEAIGQQWHWSFRLPGADGQLGAVDARLITDDNPFGMVPDDPLGRDDVLVQSNRLHLPVGQPVKLLLRSKDVLHNFAVAQFRVKMDLVPGLVSYLWLTPTKAGEFEILCEELCGVGHFAMRGTVVVQAQDAYETWLASQPTYADLQAMEPGNAAAGAPVYAVCAACHGVAGEGSLAMNSPKIAGQGGWYLRRQLEYFKTGARGAHPDDVYGAQMAPMAAILPDDAAIRNVVAYIETFPDQPVEHTVTGNAKRGERFYRTCAVCHGAQGQGIKAMNAPRQAGMSDWYLVTQLQNYQRGVRGRHPGDLYGSQMADFSRMLADPAAIDDVVAYLNTLPLPESQSDPKPDPQPQGAHLAQGR
jgi:cytochrome c oxidase subunit II